MTGMLATSFWKAAKGMNLQKTAIVNHFQKRGLLALLSGSMRELCLLPSINTKHKQKNPEVYWSNKVVERARKRALKKGVPFSISPAYVRTILPTECPIFGFPFSYAVHSTFDEKSPSLDRIIPELGYVEGNVAVISILANNIKSNSTSKDMYKVADWLHEIEKNVK